MITPTRGRVVHNKKEPYDIYIGRPSKWGNPFVIGKDGNRDQVIELYKEWLLHGKGQHLLNSILELHGKTLGCWCAPERCHGEVLENLAYTAAIGQAAADRYRAGR